MCVVCDPQITALRKRAIAIRGVPASFGDIWEPYRAVWRVGFGQGSGSEGAVGSLWKFDEPAKYNKVQAANSALAQRFATFMKFLSAGLLVAEGISRGDGKSVMIARSVWQREMSYIDFENGDLLELNPRAEDHTTALLRSRRAFVRDALPEQKIAICF